MRYFSPYERLLLGLAVAAEAAEGILTDAEAEQVLQRLQQEFGTEHVLIAFEFPPKAADEALGPTSR